MVATGNPGKRAEWEGLFVDAGLTLRPFSGESPEEDAMTYVGNALIKARAAAQSTGLPSLGDDVGLAVGALNGAPGLTTKRWAHRHGGFLPAREVLVALALGSPATYICALALVDPTSGREWTARGAVRGQIGRADQDGAGFEPCFMVGTTGRTLSAFRGSERARVHHRTRAWAALRAKLRGR